MTVPFWKVQSTGNHFVLIEPQPSWSESELERFVIQVSQPHFGVGSDGVLILRPQDGGLNLRMFNPDGTEDFCGNGLRCAAIFGRQRGMITSDRFLISHQGRDVQLITDGEIAQTTLFPATYDPVRVPHSFSHEIVDEALVIGERSYVVHALSTGSTHTVIPVSELPSDGEFFETSRLLEHHSMFPKRTSVMWMQMMGENEVNLRIWERGAGETLGCGTGSTAAAVALCRKRDRGGVVTVNNPGGSVQVELKSWNDRPVITGRAEILFEGQFEFS